MKKSSKEIFADRIKALRIQKGWSQDVLAAEAGVHRAYIGTIERCEKSVTLDTVDKFAKVFNVPVSDLFRSE